MSYLTLDADRLVRDAVDAYLEDRLRPDSGGDCVYATRNSQYRVIEGSVQEASDTGLIGAELVGWLLEELGQPEIEPRWRPYARAVFVERRSRQVVVTSRTLTRTAIGGDVPPPGRSKRKTPSVIPASPPIPVLKQNGPDASPAPFRVPEVVREAASQLDENQRPTTRPPPDEPTMAADRASYDALLEQSRTPTRTPAWGAFANPKPRSTPRPQSGSDHPPESEPKSVRLPLPPVSSPPRRNPGPAAGAPPSSRPPAEATELDDGDFDEDPS